jgi:glycosyltransferase involved in cell wall biosynthesis
MFTAEAIKAEFGITPYVLYPPISDNIFNYNGKESNEQRDNNVITVARISQGKNLEIIPHLARLTSKEIRFTIAGLLDSEKVLNSLLRLIKKLKVSGRVKILTNVKRHRLREILLSSRVYLHPTIDEHFGISIIEAMRSGCIPVVHDSGAPREFVAQNLRYRTIEEAAIKVEKALNDWSPEKAREVSKLTLRFSKKNFSKQFMEIFALHFGKGVQK